MLNKFLRYYPVIFFLLLFIVIIGTSSTNFSRKVINVQDFGVYPGDSHKESEFVKYNRWKNIKNAFDYCIENKCDMFFPSGVYDVGSRNFPFQNINNDNLLDCKNILIFGSGFNTLLKTSSNNGADVLQLNMIKNISFKDFSITADLYTTKKAGSNGISITNGFDNIVLDNIYIYDLPSVDKKTYIDGGKGLTLQFDPGINSEKGSLTATNIKVENCAYGFRFDATHVSDLLKNNIDIKLDIKIDKVFQGFSMAFGAPFEVVKEKAQLNMNVTATITNAQQYICFSRVIGGVYNFTVDKTINNEQIILDKNKRKWYNADPIYFAFLSNYSKNTKTTIKGNVGKVDVKVWMGAVGSVSEPFNLKNRTENNIFDFDILGDASLEDFRVIEYNGNSIHNSDINFSAKTLKNVGIYNHKFSDLRKNNNIIKIK
ncbi:hypothetical protein ACV0BM_005165 [Elizabethkingia meningoseptica]